MYSSIAKLYLINVPPSFLQWWVVSSSQSAVAPSTVQTEALRVIISLKWGHLLRCLIINCQEGSSSVCSLWIWVAECGFCSSLACQQVQAADFLLTNEHYLHLSLFHVAGGLPINRSQETTASIPGSCSLDLLAECKLILIWGIMWGIVTFTLDVSLDQRRIFVNAKK